jgi:hypothetical protein
MLIPINRLIGNRRHKNPENRAETNTPDSIHISPLLLALASRDWDGQVDDHGRIIARGTRGWCVNVWGGSDINPPHGPNDFSVWQDTGEVFSQGYYGPEVRC